MTEKEKYEAQIIGIMSSVVRKDETTKGMKCRVSIRLATTGLVTQVMVRGGDAQLCREAETAILRIGKLPMSSEADVYQELKNIDFTFDFTQ